jgi:hypothetical protein
MLCSKICYQKSFELKKNSYDIAEWTCWVCGTDPSTLDRERARAHQIGEPKQTETAVQG